MFEIGKRYSFVMIMDGEESSFSGHIERYDHPLVKLADTQIDPVTINIMGMAPDGQTATLAQKIETDGYVIPGKIINVTSPLFVSATISE